MEIDIPESALVVLLGDEAINKYKFVKAYFKDEEVLTLDQLENQVKERLKAHQLTVIDTQIVDEKDYEPIIRQAKRFHMMPIAIVFCGGKEGEDTLQGKLKNKGFKAVYTIEENMDLKSIELQRVRLANNKREIQGSFDIIGDVHGCYDELCELLEKLGYKVDEKKYLVDGYGDRKIVFVGDLVDRGPKSPEVLKLVMNLIKQERAYCVLGNHDSKLYRKLNGANVQVQHGLETTMEQLEGEPESFLEELKVFLEGLASHYVFDEGKLVVAHAGLKEKLHGRESPRIKDLAMFGPTTGKLDERGLPERLKWHTEYEGAALVVYGHTPQKRAKFVNNTINIDTGCVYGGKLTAFRYPEREIVEVEAKQTYYEALRPLEE